MIDFRRLSLYGRLVRTRRLFGCWDSAGQLTSSRYADRVTISDFIYFISKIGQSLSSYSYSSSYTYSHSTPHLQSQVLSRIYPTNIITDIPVFFLLYGSPRSYFPNCLSRHAAIYYHAVLPFVLLSGYSHKTIARKRASSEYFCVRMCPVLDAVNSLTRHNLNCRLERVGFRDDAIVLVLGTLGDERRRLRHEP